MTMNRHLFAMAAAVALAMGVTPGTVPYGRSGEAVEAAAAAPGQSSGQIEPRAGTWKTWVLTSPRQFRLPAPPSDRAVTDAEMKTLRDLSTRRNAEGRLQIEFWSAGGSLYRWDRIALDESLSHLLNTNRGARALALVSVAMYDAIVAAWDSKYAYNRPRPSVAEPSLVTAVRTPESPSYPSEHAVVAGAASAVLAYLFPDDAVRLSSLAEEDGRAQLLAGIQYPSDVAAGIEMGRKVAALVIERGRGDGSGAAFNGQIPKGPGYWTGTDPIEPMMGSWKTWVLQSGAQFRPGPPPAYDSEQKKAELAEIKTFLRTPKSNDAAFFWQFAVAGTRGYHWWHEHVGEQVAFHGLESNPPRAARAYALQSVTNYDVTVACWDGKYTYWAIRPFQLDPEVKTLFPTPNHPSYPAAHACVSGGNAVILSYLFPSEASRFMTLAEQAGESRVWAGIHYRSDLVSGFELARKVAGAVIERARVDGSR
jgi:membrane-associated phospholipid phosphatase